MSKPCEVFYKVLGPRGEAVNGGHGQWPLPHGSRPGKWIEVTGPLRACQNGLHVCRLEQLVDWLGSTIWRVEIQGERIEQSDKIVARQGRLLSRCEGWTDKSARLFAVACARRALERERKAGREPDTRSWNALTVATAYANGLATDEQLIIAGAAAGDATWAVAEAAGGAAWAATWDAVEAATWDAAKAAEAATEAAVGTAVGDATWAAVGTATEAATGAAWAAAWTAERQWQLTELKKVLEGRS